MLFDHGFFRRTASRLMMSALASVCLAGATTITTNNFNTWKTPTFQTGAPTELNFMAITSSSYNTASGITLTGAGASSMAATFVGMNGANYSLAGDVYAKTLSAAPGAAASINIMFVNPQNAFFVSFANPSSMLYTITLSDGQMFNTNTRFMGFSVSHMITSMTVSTTPSNTATINDFFFGTSSLAQDAAPSPDPGTPAATPEPATMMLVAGGVLIGAGAKKRWGKK